MIVLDSRRGRIRGIVLIASPVIARLSLCGLFVWTVGRSGWEILSAAFRSLSKEVVLLEGDVTHPCWIITTVGAAALAEVRKEVVTCGGTWSVMPRLVFVLGVDGALGVGAICAIGIPWKVVAGTRDGEYQGKQKRSNH